MKKEYDWQTVLGQAPSKSNTYMVVRRGGHGGLAKSKKLKEYEKSFYTQIGKYKGLNIQGFFELEVRVYFTTMAHDLDNSLKCLLDCLQQTETIKNDNRCMRIVADKFVDKINPRVEFRLIEIEL